MITSSGSDLNYCKLRMPETKHVCESRIVEISMSGLMRGAGVIPPLLLYWMTCLGPQGRHAAEEGLCRPFRTWRRITFYTQGDGPGLSYFAPLVL